MLSLVIDTAGDEAQVLLAQDAVVVAKRAGENQKDTGAMVLGWANELLQEVGRSLGDVERVGVFIGPGNRWSALRAGVTVANTLSWAARATLVQLGDNHSMEALARAVFLGQPVSVAEPKYPHHA